MTTNPNDERRASMFNTLYNLNVNDKTEKKDNLTYLSWAYAWAEFKKIYPSATYRIVSDPETHLPYFQDSLGIMVMTEVSADDLNYQMWLPVMDSKNKAMKKEPYTYQVWDNYSKQYIEKTVNAATMFDINKTIMRCLVKNLSMFGLGLYIYAGEDLPESETGNAEASSNQAQPQQAPQKRTYTRRSVTSTATAPQQSSYDPYRNVREAISKATDMNSLMTVYQQFKTLCDADPNVKVLFTQARLNLNNAA